MSDPRDTARAFDGLAREFFTVWFRFHPQSALAAGNASSGDLLPPQSDDEHAALGSWLETLIVALEELDFQDLDPARRLDLELMFALARVEHRELAERDWRRRDPGRYLPLGSIHRLTLLRPERLREALVALLAAVPDYLRLAQTQLLPTAELVPPVLVRAACAAAEDGRRYLRELARGRWLRQHCHGRGEIEALAETAAGTLAQYAATLEREIAPRAAGSAGCGPGYLGFLLQRRHCLRVPAVGLDDWLAALAGRLDAALAAIPPEVDEASPGVRERFRDECAAIAERLDAAGLVTLPGARLRVTAGPVCPQPHAGRIDYVADLRRGEGVLYVPDGDDGCERPLSAGMLRLRALMCGFGGAHLLAFAGGMAARSLPRRLARSTTLAGGLPLAIAGRLLGAAEAPATERRAALAEQAQAVALARIELDLHVGRTDADQALARLVALEGDERPALATLAGLIRRPGDAIARGLGWQMIERARAEHAGEARDFHDRLLACGPVPVALALRSAFGEGFVAAVEAGLGIGPQAGPATAREAGSDRPGAPGDAP